MRAPGDHPHRGGAARGEFCNRLNRRLDRRLALPVRPPYALEEEGRLMKAARPLVFVLLVCGLALAAACGDRAVTAPPPPAASADLIGSLLGATGLLQCSNLPYDSTTQTVGIGGRSLSVRRHTPVIPAGALHQPTAITGLPPPGLGADAAHVQTPGAPVAGTPP